MTATENYITRKQFIAQLKEDRAISEIKDTTQMPHGS